MSRKSVYRAGRTHHIPYGPEVDSSVVRWSFLPVELQATSEDETGITDVKPRPFTVRTWVIDENAASVDDGDANEKVEFKIRATKIVEEVPASPNGLSASDIRGAVGGEAIPGISGSSYSKHAEGETDTPSPDPSASHGKSVGTQETTLLKTVSATETETPHVSPDGGALTATIGSPTDEAENDTSMAEAGEENLGTSVAQEDLSTASSTNDYAAAPEPQPDTAPAEATSPFVKSEADVTEDVEMAE